LDYFKYNATFVRMDKVKGVLELKVFISIILSTILLLALSACETSSEGTAAQNQSQPETSIKTKNSSKSNDLKESSTSKPNTPSKTINGSNTDNSSRNSQQSSSPNSLNENNESKEAFYGQWQINKVIVYGPAGTYSSDDVKMLIGKQLTFSKDQATCFGDKMEDLNETVTNPVYKKTVIAKNDFPANYRVTFEQLGINSDSVTKVDATSTKGIGAVIFITPDNNKLILFGGGTFFELDNLSTSSNEQLQNQLTPEETNQNKAVSLVKDYLNDKNELVQDKNHFVQFEEMYNDYYIVRYSTLVSGHSSTNGRYAVDINSGEVIDITDATDLSFLNE